MSQNNRSNSRQDAPNVPPIVFVVIAVVVLLFAASQVYKTVPAGHIGVASLFGKVQDKTYDEGLHFPVNPFLSWTVYDARQKTHKEVASVPSQDQLTTTVDVSVQYRVDKKLASSIKKNTGSLDQVVDVHLIPKLRSLMREQGKGVERAEDFFNEDTQQRMQESLTAALREFLEPEGVTVGSVLIRDVKLPARLIDQIQTKKEAEQRAEAQKAELERYRTEQLQAVAKAEAERSAAEEDAQKLRVLADAKAYEIEKINAALANAPGYIQLQALEALKSMATDPAAKLYFMNSDSPMPLPLMNLGESFSD